MMTMRNRAALEGSLSIRKAPRLSWWRQARIWWLNMEHANHTHIILRLEHERAVAVADRGMIADKIKELQS